MSSPRNPLSLARRWTAGVLLASTLGAGAVGVHLAQDQGSTTASAAGTTSSGSSSSSSGTSSSTGSTGFSAVPGVSSGTGSAQTSTSGS